MDHRDLRDELEAVKAQLAALHEEWRVEKASRIGPRLRAAAADPRLRLALLCAAVVIPTAAYAAVIGVPFTFSSGTLADANQVNANFDSLVAESNDQDGRIGVLESALAAVQADVSANTSDIATGQSSLSLALKDINANGSAIADNASGVSTNSSGITTNAASAAANAAAVALNAVGLAGLNSTFTGVGRAGDLLTFSGMNVRVTDGSGNTMGATNGLGNLIVGYNENIFGATRTGSHNLVVGWDHEYTSYAGAVIGRRNTIHGLASSVTGGNNNITTVNGSYASLSGGWGNTVDASFASVSGGSGNTASGDRSSVTGGWDNTASGPRSSVTGGWDNTASGPRSSVAGGESVVASGVGSVVAGGQNTKASGDYSTALGTVRVLSISGP